MSNYTKTTNFGAKDTLPSGDSQKIIRGTEFDTEFNNVATAIATKLEVDGSNNLAISGTFSSTKLIPTGGTATGNGMYLPAANAVAISTNGTERLRIDSSGVASFASNLILNGGTANGLVYLDGSKVATSGSAVTFDGTNLATTGTASATKLIPTGGTATGNGMYLPAANTLALSTNGTERVRVDSSGNLGIGTASPGAKLDIGGTNNTVFFKNSGATTGYALAAVSNTGGAFQYGISSSTGTFWGSGNAGNYSANIGTTTATNLGFGTNDTLRMLLDSSGNLGLGVVPSAWRTLNRALQIGSVTSLVNIDATGSSGFDLGSNLYFDSGSTTRYLITGAPATYYRQQAGAHLWNTAPSGTAGDAITFTQAMTLDASGNLSVGTTTASTQITFNGSSGITYQRSTNNNFSGVLDYLKSRGSAGSPTAVQNEDDIFLLRVAPYQGSAYTYLNSQLVSVDGTFTSGQNPPTRISWYTNVANGSSTERARITSGGDLYVGTTGAIAGSNARLQIDSGTTFGQITKSGGAATSANTTLWHVATTGDNIFVDFGTEASFTSRGSIDYNRAGGLTRYNTTSDYRAKDIIGPVQNPGATIDALKVYEGKMKGATQSRPMLVAHEAQEHAPYAVSGVKDELNEDGTPKFQQMDVSSLVPLLLAEIQSLRTRVATLENN